MTQEGENSIRIAVVGVCASGKSTLIAALQDAGYTAQHVAQEHSYVPTMWQRISRPDLLIYLDADYQTVMARRPRSTLVEADLEEQKRRLAHARTHCDLYLDTSGLNPVQVQKAVLHFLGEYVPD